MSSEFFPVADSYASALHENDGHGDLPYLRADNQPRRTMYLKFDVQGIRVGSTVALKLWIEKKTRTGLQLHGTGNDWEESSLTFENAPAPGPVAAESGPLPRESWIRASHQLIWHGRRICYARRPDCANCPIAPFCPSAGREL